MDSINFIKGYGKVQDLELQHQSPNPNTNTQKKPLVTAVSILAILFLSLTLGAMFGVLVHMAASDPPSSSSSNSAVHDTDSVIKAVCNVTRYPDSCFSSITSFSLCSSCRKLTDPEAIFKLSLRVSIAELSNFKNTMISNSNQGVAFSDCRSQIEDAVSRLNDSVVAMEVCPGGEKALTETKISDLRTWISAAMTDQETCLDGLEETGSTALDEVKTKMKKSQEYTSNCLAILANIHTLLRNFTNSKCTVKKRVERSSDDPTIVITTYEGQHCHHTIGFPRGGIISQEAFAGQLAPPISQFYYPTVHHQLPQENPFFITQTRQTPGEAAGESRVMPQTNARPPIDEGLLGDIVPPNMRNR